MKPKWKLIEIYAEQNSLIEYYKDITTNSDYLNNL